MSLVYPGSAPLPADRRITAGLNGMLCCYVQYSAQFQMKYIIGTFSPSVSD